MQRDSLRLLARLRQDSIQSAQVAPSLRLVRGLGQRIGAKNTIQADAAYFMFLRQHLSYPEMALKCGMEGQLTVQLHVSPDGSVTSCQVTQAAFTKLNEFEDVPLKAGIKLEEVARRSLLQQTRVLLRHLVFEPAASSSQEELMVTYTIR